MNRSTAVAALALLLAFPRAALTAPASAPAAAVDVTPAVAARLDETLRAATGSRKGLTPALSVAVVENGRIVYAQAFGTADVAAKTPATPQTRFRIGSVTKMFTAVAVMQLVESGRVGLDARLATYLPDVPHASEVTIRQLLTHTAGFWNYGDEVFGSARVTTPVTPREIVAYVGARPLDHPPGTIFSYSNTGYVLLGLVVEAVTHQTLAAYEREHVFLPANMNDTTVGDAAPGAPAALGYADATGTLATPFSPAWVYADGDIVSTASDLARFDIALMGGRLVKPETFALMQSSAVAADELGSGIRYGFGLGIVSSGGVTFVGHHGGVPGFESETEMVPAQRYAIVVLSDAFDFVTSVANRAMIKATLPSVAAAAAAQAAAATPAPTGVEDPAVTAKLRTFLTGLQHGTVDRTTLTTAMNNAFTDQAIGQVRDQFADYGALQTLAFHDRTSTQGYAVFHYGAKFANGKTVPLTISFDKDGKIAGFFGG